MVTGGDHLGLLGLIQGFHIQLGGGQLPFRDVVGEQVLASYWREGVGFLNNVSQGGRVRTDLTVPDNAISLVEGMARYLGINHAGFDVAMVDGHPYILEFNRLFGNTGIPDLNQRVQRAMSHYLLGDPSSPPSSDNKVSA